MADINGKTSSVSTVPRTSGDCKQTNGRRFHFDFYLLLSMWEFHEWIILRIFFSFTLRSFPEKNLQNDEVHDALVPDSGTISPAPTDLRNDAKPTSQPYSDEFQFSQNEKTDKRGSFDTNGDKKQGVHEGDTSGKTAAKGPDEKGIERGCDRERNQVNGRGGNVNETHEKSDEQRAVGSENQSGLQSNPDDKKNTPLESVDAKDVNQSGGHDFGTSGTVVTKTKVAENIKNSNKESISTAEKAENLSSKNTEESTSISKGELKNFKMQSGDNKESSPAVQSNKNNLQNNEGRSDHSAAKMERSRLDKDCINVVFQALLTPTFGFQPGYNKVVLRGNSPFSWHPGRQLEMRVGR